MALRVATTSTTQAKRPRHPPGYYRTLHNRSSADVLGVGTDDRSREHGKLQLRADRDLPEGCYEVEHLVAKMRRKVIATVIYVPLRSVVEFLLCMVVGICLQFAQAIGQISLYTLYSSV